MTINYQAKQTKKNVVVMRRSKRGTERLLTIENDHYHEVLW